VDGCQKVAITFCRIRRSFRNCLESQLMGEQGHYECTSSANERNHHQRFRNALSPFACVREHELQNDDAQSYEECGGRYIHEPILSSMVLLSEATVKCFLGGGEPCDSQAAG